MKSADTPTRNFSATRPSLFSACATSDSPILSHDAPAWGGGGEPHPPLPKGHPLSIASDRRGVPRVGCYALSSYTPIYRRLAPPPPFFQTEGGGAGGGGPPPPPGQKKDRPQPAAQGGGGGAGRRPRWNPGRA